MTLYRNLAAENPAHQPELAMTLGNCGLSPNDLGRHSEALACDREALEVYARLADNDPDLYEETYKRDLATLRRVYDLRGDQLASVNRHLNRDRSSDQGGD